MTISTTASKVVCLGNGSTSVFTYNFLIPLASDAVVIFTDVNGNSQTLSTSQYTISGIGNPAGGSVVYPTSGSPIGFGTTLTIQRLVPLAQNTSISNQGAFYPEVVEAALDTATMQIQQLNTAIINSLQVPVTDSSAPTTLPGAVQRAGQMLGFDSFGNPIAASPSSALVSSVMQPFVSAVSLAAAANLLGLPVFVGVGTTTGTANAQVLSGTIPGTFAFMAGNKIAAIPGFTNSGPMTLTVGVIPATSVFKRSATGPVALVGGEVVASQLANFTCDGTYYILEEQGILTNPTLYMKNSAAPAPSIEGDLQWDSVHDRFVIGNGGGQVYFAQNPQTTVDKTVPRHLGTTGITQTSNVTISDADLLTAPGGLAGASGVIPFQKLFESAQQTITFGGSLTLAHGLGAQPKLYLLFLQCTTANAGFSIGDEIEANPGLAYGNLGGQGSDAGISVWPDATNINVRFGSSLTVISKGGGASNITAGSWKLVVRAWA